MRKGKVREVRVRLLREQDRHKGQAGGGAGRGALAAHMLRLLAEG